MDDNTKRNDSGDSDDEPSDSESVNNELNRENLERLIGVDDSAFSGIDLATLIRKKYGRSYDVQLIKKKSFPLNEEEYLLRLDDVANTLKCWGAVSHIRNSLEKRPRIGKGMNDETQALVGPVVRIGIDVKAAALPKSDDAELETPVPSPVLPN